MVLPANNLGERDGVAGSSVIGVGAIKVTIGGKGNALLAANATAAASILASKSVISCALNKPKCRSGKA